MENIAVSTALIVHIIAMITWIGAMYFNLVIQFPMLRARCTSPEEYQLWMGHQGILAAKWLYLCVLLMLLSGLFLALSSDLSFQYLLVKGGVYILMLSTHLYSSFALWPRVFFATGEESRRLFIVYEVLMYVSAGLGTMLIAYHYLAQ